MAENSKIEWTDHTFNPWIGCTKVSPGCAHCYAAQQDEFRKWTPEGWGPGKPRKRTKTWRDPLKWDREAKQSGAGPRVFCASLADWLDDDGVPIEWFHDLLDLIGSTPFLRWQLLTKRPQNWRARVGAAAARGSALAQRWLAGEEPSNVWLGTTVEDQLRAEERVPLLLDIPARVRFLSCEPLLGPVDLVKAEALFTTDDKIAPNPEDPGFLPLIHWVICGGESGPGARPMHPEWARSLEAQCHAANVAFFFKQWGDWIPERQEMPRERTAPAAAGYTFDDGVRAFRVGKINAGRQLDGIEHNDGPSE